MQSLRPELRAQSHIKRGTQARATGAQPSRALGSVETVTKTEDRGAGKMACQVKVLATDMTTGVQPGELHDGNRTDSQKLSSNLHKDALPCMHTAILNLK